MRLRSLAISNNLQFCAVTALLIRSSHATIRLRSFPDTVGLPTVCCLPLFLTVSTVLHPIPTEHLHCLYTRSAVCSVLPAFTAHRFYTNAGRSSLPVLFPLLFCFLLPLHLRCVTPFFASAPHGLPRLDYAGPVHSHFPTVVHGTPFLLRQRTTDYRRCYLPPPFVIGCLRVPATCSVFVVRVGSVYISVLP